MAFSTLNDQITDSVAQTAVGVIGLAPAIAMGDLYVATSQALADAAHNATLAQQNNNQIAHAATLLAVKRLQRLAK
jgi:isocitrate dehydrogenase